MTTLYIALTIVFFSLLSITYKLAHTKKCNTAAFVGTLNLVAASIGYAILLRQPSHPSIGGILALGALGGLSSALCLTFLVGALRRNGPLAIVNTLINLSLLIPIVFATLFMGEHLTIPRAAGLFLFVVFVVILKLSTVRNPDPTRSGPAEPRLNWLAPASAAFLLNGIVLITQRGIGEWYPGGENLFLLGLFLVAALVCGLALIRQRYLPTVTDLVIGTLAGAVSYGGNLCLIRALSISGSYRVLPLTFGVWMVVVTILSRLFFKERLTRGMVLALCLGIASIVLLNMTEATP